MQVAHLADQTSTREGLAPRPLVLAVFHAGEDT